MGYGRDFNSTSDPFSGFDRIRVDEAQTSFFEGREFRVFEEFTLASGASKTYKLVCTSDFIVYSLALASDSGYMRLSSWSAIGATETSAFTQVFTPICTNNMTGAKNRRRKPDGSYHTTRMTVSAGGSFIGGVQLDSLRLKSAQNSTQAASVGAGTSSERGAAAGTYYIRVDNLDTNSQSVGVISARWEERPAGAFDA